MIRKATEEDLSRIAETFDADHLWALEKNTRAIAFYHRHGFMENGEKELEEGTTEYIIKMIRVEDFEWQYCI